MGIGTRGARGFSMGIGIRGARAFSGMGGGGGGGGAVPLAKSVPATLPLNMPPRQKHLPTVI